MEANEQQKSLEVFIASQKEESTLTAEIQEKVVTGLSGLQSQLRVLLEELDNKKNDTARIASERQKSWDVLQDLYTSGKLIPAGTSAHIEELENTLSEQKIALEEAQAQTKQAEKLLEDGASPEVKRQISEMEGNLEKRRETINIARNR
ncbi:MAG: hypothetical protein KAH38_03175, partial [Candidatus Hydrogenedentes bacterium]|nr:hypothetical protein [Candidatus Hydrogenedentota bacterium]